MAGGLALSAVLLAAFAIQQSRLDKPMLDPGVFVRRAMIGIAILLFAVSVGYWAVLVYLPLATAFDWSSEVAGLALLAAFTVLVVHSLLYSGFFEDPFTWGIVGLAAACLSLALHPAPADLPAVSSMKGPGPGSGGAASGEASA